QHLPAVDAGHDDVEEDEVGSVVLDRLERVLGAFGFAYGVALDLEVHPHVLAQTGVIVDDEHERPAGLARRPGAVDEELEVAPSVAPVATRRVEGRDPALVRPLADRRLCDPEELGRLAEGEPLGLAAGLPAVRRRSGKAVHRPKLPKASATSNL